MQSNEKEDIPKRDFLILKSDTGDIKMGGSFNIENVNGSVNLLAFLENKQLFQINGINAEDFQKEGIIDMSLANVVVVRPPQPPCTTIDRGKNFAKRMSNEKRTAFVFSLNLSCDGVTFICEGAFTGETPQSFGQRTSLNYF